MSFDSEKEKERIKSLIFNCKLKEAHKVTKDLLKKDNMSKEDELKIIVLQSEVLNYFGKFHKANKLSEKVLKESEEINNNLLKADAYLEQTMSLYYLGKYKESQEAGEKGLELIQDDEKYELKYVAKTKLYLYMNLGVLAFEFGEIQKGTEIASTLQAYAEKTGIDYILGIAASFRGFSYIFSGEIEKADKSIEKGLEIAHSVGKHAFLTHVYFTYATAKQTLRKYDTALEYHKKGIDLSLEMGLKLLLFGFYLHTAVIYSIQYNLDKALEYNKLALEEAWVGLYVLFINVGAIYLLKNDNKEAKNNFQKGLQNSKKVGELRVRPVLLYHLVLVSLLLNETKQAEEYMKELEELSNTLGQEQITIQYKFAEVLLLKESTRMQDWFKAVEILEEQLASEKLHISFQIDALFHLVEIRLKELQVTADKEILTEVKKHIETMQTYAEDRKQFSLLANIYRLKSQLALVELNAEKSVELLITAKTLAEEKNLDSILINIQDEQAKLKQQQNMWNRMKEQKTSLEETLKEVHLDNSVKQLAKETVIEVQDERTGGVIEYRKLFALKI
ncbi:MAG: hypothetical protein GNW80_15900 [Asgard group archaeon]|nr:hypothetical protein [Asgard group archaeon]